MGKEWVDSRYRGTREIADGFWKAMQTWGERSRGHGGRRDMTVQGQRRQGMDSVLVDGGMGGMGC